MARTIARRRVGRRRVGRTKSGRFVSLKRRSTRRRRRNPSGFIRVRARGRRKWRKITNYAKRSRRSGRIRGFKFPKSYRRRRRSRVRRNPFVLAPRRRRRSSGRRSYRRVRRNPGAASVGYRLSRDPIAAIKNAVMSAFSTDTLETLFHLGLGFGGSVVASRLLIKKLIPTLGETSYGRVGGTLGTTLLGTALLGIVAKDAKMTSRFLAGGLLATLWQGLSEFLPSEAKEFIPTLGDAAESDAFRKAIEREVLKELRSGGGVHGLPAAGAEGYSTYLTPSGVSYVRPAGSEAYLTEREGDRATMGAYLTERTVERVEAHPSGVGDQGFDEFSRESLPEKF